MAYRYRHDIQWTRAPLDLEDPNCHVGGVLATSSLSSSEYYPHGQENITQVLCLVVRAVTGLASPKPVFDFASLGLVMSHRPAVTNGRNVALADKQKEYKSMLQTHCQPRTSLQTQQHGQLHDTCGRVHVLRSHLYFRLRCQGPEFCRPVYDGRQPFLDIATSNK